MDEVRQVSGGGSTDGFDGISGAMESWWNSWGLATIAPDILVQALANSFPPITVQAPAPSNQGLSFDWGNGDFNIHILDFGGFGANASVDIATIKGNVADIVPKQAGVPHDIHFLGLTFHSGGYGIGNPEP